MKKLICYFSFLAIVLSTICVSGQIKTTDEVLKSYFKEDVELQLKVVPDSVNIKLEFPVASYSLNYIIKGKDTVGYFYINISQGCKITGCENDSIKEPDSTNQKDEYEEFTFCIIFDKELTIKNVSVIDYKSEFGAEISDKKWLKQYIGYKSGKLKYGKDVDAISGATTSVINITKDIEGICKSLNKLKKLGIF